MELKIKKNLSQKRYSICLEENIINKINEISKELNCTKKSLLEYAITKLIEDIDKNGLY